jgi:hypothetical protein
MLHPISQEEAYFVVNQLITRFRGLFVAIVALALSASVAFAWGGPPQAATDGLATAAAAADKTVPARADEAPNAGADEDADEGDESEAPEADAPEDGSATDNHGALVSEAANMETPEGFDNHGQFVSCVARMNHGHEDPNAEPPAQPIDLSALTPEDCGLTDAATQATKAPKANGKSKDHSTHGKSGNAPGHNR